MDMIDPLKNLDKEADDFSNLLRKKLKDTENEKDGTNDKIKVINEARAERGEPPMRFGKDPKHIVPNRRK